MPNTSTFIEQAEALILKNLANEQFGVSELADAMNMSRSNLLRKIKKQTKLSASQFIRQVRLKEAMDLLKEGSLTVSEISYQVGFGSTSYFIKCFRELYGYPPGEVGKGTVEVETKSEKLKPSFLKAYRLPIIAVSTLALLVVVLSIFIKKDVVEASDIEKSIAVLPFRNESSDSTNLYFVNGLMESTLNDLQRIGDLLVISRTSSEKYRKTAKSIPEIAEELNVSYLVEGSGQRIGNQVLLNIKLIEASTDTPVWTGQYQEEVEDIFKLQREVAQKISTAIRVAVTPSELHQLQKIPTENMVAYDYYLKGLEAYNKRNDAGYQKAIPHFEKAVAEDPKFALAYAHLAMCYYLKEQFKSEKQFTEQINTYADKALLHDPKNDLSLIAKAFYYMNTSQFRLAVPHLEKALEYNPNSVSAIQLLSLLYSIYVPNTTKYLKNALKGVRLDITANDDKTNSFIYLNLSNAFAQNGFNEEALNYINKTLELDENNYFAPHLKIFIEYAIDENLENAKQRLLRELEKDSLRLDLLQETAKMFYFQEDYEGAYTHYKRFVNLREAQQLNVYPHEDLKIGIVYSKMGQKEKAQDLFRAYSEYCEKDESIYKNASLAFKYAHEGNIDQGIAQLKIFATQDDIQYWALLFLEEDPLIRPLRQHPEYEETVQKIKDLFWENQAKLRASLEEEGLI